MIAITGLLLVVSFQNCGNSFETTSDQNESMTESFALGSAELGTNIESSTNDEDRVSEKLSTNLYRQSALEAIYSYTHPNKGPGALLVVRKGQALNGSLGPGKYLDQFRVSSDDRFLFVSACSNQAQPRCYVFVEARRFRRNQVVNFSVRGIATSPTGVTSFGNHTNKKTYAFNYSCAQVNSNYYCPETNNSGQVVPQLGHHFRADGLFFMYLGSNGSGHNCRLARDKFDPAKEIPRPSDVERLRYHVPCNNLSYDVVGTAGLDNTSSSSVDSPTTIPTIIGEGVKNLRFKRYGQSGEVFWENPANIKWVLVDCRVNGEKFAKSFGNGETSFYIPNLKSNLGGWCDVATAYQDGRRTEEKKVLIPVR